MIHLLSTELLIQQGPKDLILMNSLTIHMLKPFVKITPFCNVTMRTLIL